MPFPAHLGGLLHGLEILEVSYPDDIDNYLIEVEITVFDIDYGDEMLLRSLGWFRSQGRWCYHAFS